MSSTRLAVIFAILLAALIGFRSVDFAHRLLSPDLVAVAFGEGGDDGYYYFTVARNIASGHGITIDQVHWTSGFQPLWMVVCALAFLAPERVAMALIYAASVASWLACGLLLVRFARQATGRNPAPLAALSIAAIFLCDEQISIQAVNGMDTGLALAVSLWLLIAFQRHLQDAAAPATTWRLIGLGLLSGLAMLARNDAVFLCGALLGAMVIAGKRPRAIREAIVIVVVASLVLLPWLLYCQWVFGVPVPQSGIATSVALRGFHMAALDTLRGLVDAITPMLFAGQHNLMIAHPWLTIAVVSIAGAAAVALWHQPPRPTVDPATALVLIGLAASCVPLVAYYWLFSGAFHFFERYFLPIKMLVMMLLSILIARGFANPRPFTASAVPALAAVCGLAGIVTNDFRTWRDFYLPYRGYMGEYAYDVPRSPFWAGTSKIGMAESGRLGFLLPARVVNLDGKMRTDALRALSDRRLGDFLAHLDIDYVLLQDFDVWYFDQRGPNWRHSFAEAGKIGDYFIFARNRTPR